MSQSINQTVSEGSKIIKDQSVRSEGNRKLPSFPVFVISNCSEMQDALVQVFQKFPLGEGSKIVAYSFSSPDLSTSWKEELHSYPYRSFIAYFDLRSLSSLEIENFLPKLQKIEKEGARGIFQIFIVPSQHESEISSSFKKLESHVAPICIIDKELPPEEVLLAQAEHLMASYTSYFNLDFITPSPANGNIVEGFHEVTGFTD